MSKARAVIIALTVVGVLVGGLIFLSDQNETQQTTQTSVPQNQASGGETSEADQGTLYTQEEVAMHNTAGDCWTIINDVVYDLTSFISSHPGGEEILRACGIDGSSLFNDRQTTDGQSVGSGTPHSSTAHNILSSLRIGVLTN